MNKQKITRLTLNDLSRLVESTAKRVMTESADQDRNIRYALEILDEMKQSLNAIGQRLYNTPFRKEYGEIYRAIEKLKSNLLNAPYKKRDRK